MGHDSPMNDSELRRLKFSSALQVFAAIFFLGAGTISGVSLGWGFVAFLLLALGLVNIGLFVVTRHAIRSRTEGQQPGGAER